MEIYVEQTVLNKDIDAKQKRNKILSSLKYVFIACIFVCFFLFLISPISEESALSGLLLNFLFFILSASPFVLGIVLLTRYLNKSRQEFDYLLNGGVFRVVRVINRMKRKLLLEFNVSSIESIGRVISETHDRLASSNGVKKHFAICDSDDESLIFYIFYKDNGIGQILYISPDEQMAIALRRSVSRISIIDKSYNMSTDSKVL